MEISALHLLNCLREQGAGGSQGIVLQEEELFGGKLVNKSRDESIKVSISKGTKMEKQQKRKR